MASTLFFISLIGLSILFGSKIFEIKVRKIDFISRLFMKGDEKIHELIALAIFKYHNYKKIAGLFIFDFLPSYTYELLVKLKDYVAKKYYSTGDGFRGRRVLRSDGSVSAFLERLSEKRTDSLNNKI
jgi:hypothetical protein